MIVIWCMCCFVIGFCAALGAWLVCAYAWKLFTAALRRMGDGS